MTATDGITPQPIKKRPRAPVRAWRAVRGIAKDPAGTASLIALLFGVAISMTPGRKTYDTSLHSIGYALVGAATFSFIYQFWANDALVRLIITTVTRSQRRTHREFAKQWRELAISTSALLSEHQADLALIHRRHWPLEIYPKGNAPNPDFNHQLESDLLRATRYDFRGQSGKHLASRLLTRNYPRLRAVRVIVEDATIPEVMNARIDEKRFAEPGLFNHQSDDEIRAVILNNMFESLIGFHEARTRFESLEVEYASRSTDVRVEIVDGTVYISPFVRNRPRAYRYPEVFRYDPQSVPAEVTTLEFDREFGLLSSTRIRFDSTTLRGDLLGHLRAKGWDLEEADFQQRCRQAEQSLRTLSNAMGESADEALE